MKQLFCILVVIWRVLAWDTQQRNRDEILDFHNCARENVQPPASNMQKMNYSAELERLAFDWVRRCKFHFPDPATYPQFKDIGQNLALMAINSPDWVRIAQPWFDKAIDYDYDRNSCRGECGNYKQMVWATTTEVGCAAYRCDSLKPEWDPPVYLFACQYKPQGNYVGERPYESGPSCSGCPLGSVCERNLCVTRQPDISERPIAPKKPVDRIRPSAKCLPPLDP
uniref:SCP domain-containing protein n=1 Tax=Mesocestoides corti TaxID=53468 RepID=A0A5K3FI37_MESCO